MSRKDLSNGRFFQRLFSEMKIGRRKILREMEDLCASN
jgi:hypothetical protein